MEDDSQSMITPLATCVGMIHDLRRPRAGQKMESTSGAQSSLEGGARYWQTGAQRRTGLSLEAKRESRHGEEANLREANP